jgi:hypothetical protein
MFCFVETTRERLHLRQTKLGSVKDREHTYKFYLNLFYFTKLLNMATVRNFDVQLAQTLNHRVEFYNIVHCHTFVDYLTHY